MLQYFLKTLVTESYTSGEPTRVTIEPSRYGFKSTVRVSQSFGRAAIRLEDRCVGEVYMSGQTIGLYSVWLALTVINSNRNI